MSRKFPRKIKRVVIKLGSSVIATYKMRPRVARLRSLVDQICILQNKGIDVTLVSSGAIVLGMGTLNQNQRPSDLATLQVMAAIGQMSLIRKYDDLFLKNDRKCAQVLLTWDDFDDRRRFNNARDTLNAMMERNICPIINENDTISINEICFGDNDKLSALVASLVRADLLIILSDVEGLYTVENGQKKVLQEIAEITEDIERIASGPKKKNMSKGGMIAKLDAIKISAHANIPCIIANGETENVLLRIIKGEPLGTFFSEKKEKILARKHWIAFGVKPKGVLTVDKGAEKALSRGGKSLLMPGIMNYKGDFKKNDVVVVENAEHNQIARGIVNYSIKDFMELKNQKGIEVIHCDNFVKM